VSVVEGELLWWGEMRQRICETPRVAVSTTRHRQGERLWVSIFKFPCLKPSVEALNPLESAQRNLCLVVQRIAKPPYQLNW
jgi:hypothetical protein